MPGPAAERVTIVSVCFNSLAVLPGMLASVPFGCPVVLVDNGSDDIGAVAELAARHGARLIRNETNRGFGAACNQGAAVAETEFLLFLNPDAALAPGALTALVAGADRYPDASGFNPRIAGPGGRPYFKRSSNLMPRAERMPRGWPAADREVTVLFGGALMVRRAAFEAIGGFDARIFLYHEDDDLSRRLRAQAGPVMFLRDPLVEHLGGRSSARSPQNAALKARAMGRSRVYAMAKHGIPLAFWRSLATALVQLVSPVVLVSRRKRAKQWAFFRGVLSAGRDGGGAG